MMNSEHQISGTNEVQKSHENALGASALKFKSTMVGYEASPGSLLTEEQFRGVTGLKVDPFFYSAMWQIVVGSEEMRVLSIHLVYRKKMIRSRKNQYQDEPCHKNTLQNHQK
jgi:hypothetical protein